MLKHDSWNPGNHVFLWLQVLFWCWTCVAIYVPGSGWYIPNIGSLDPGTYDPMICTNCHTPQLLTAGMIQQHQRHSMWNPPRHWLSEQGPSKRPVKTPGWLNWLMILGVQTVTDCSSRNIYIYINTIHMFTLIDFLVGITFNMLMSMCCACTLGCTWNLLALLGQFEYTPLRVLKVPLSNSDSNSSFFQPSCLQWQKGYSGKYQGTIGCTPNSVPMIFIVFSRDSWGL